MAGAVGGIGEKLTAALLASADLGPGALVFHDLVPGGGHGNIDHVVMRGDTLVVIDSKRWRPGAFRATAEPTYRDVWDERGQCWARQASHRDLVTRDGRDFDAGAASSLPFLSDKLVAELGWAGRVVRLLVVSSSSGDDGDLDFNGFALSHCVVVRSVDLVAMLRQILERSRTRPVARWAHRLRSMTTSPATVASPYPVALYGPLPQAPPVTADAPPFPGVVAITAGVGLAASLLVHALGHGLGMWGFATAVPGLVAAVLMKVASDPVERAVRGFGPWIAARYVINRVLDLRRPTGPDADRAELAWVSTAAGAVLFPVASVVVGAFDRLPLMNAGSGALRVLGLILYGLASLGLVGGPVLLWSQYRLIARLSEEWEKDWEVFSRDAAELPPWAIPLMAVAMGEQDASLAWFNHLSQSRSSAWRELALEALRQAARTEEP